MFISYAQNFEDVILWRALKHIHNGFYVDIGAQDPVIDSVSRGFYENGWRGVSVEPTPSYWEKLRQNRPDELVVQAAVGESADIIKFYSFPATGLSTANADVAQQHKDNGFVCEELTVKTISLASILDGFQDRPIHWMKIDVEGMEGSVLRSWAGSKVRPWILVVEATQPQSQILSYDEWDDIILDNGYSFVYFDGLNRFYVSEHHQDLAGKFGPGANVFDEFKLHQSSSYIDNAALFQEKARANDLFEKNSKQSKLIDELQNQIISTAVSNNYLAELLHNKEAEIKSLSAKINYLLAEKASMSELIEKTLHENILFRETLEKIKRDEVYNLKTIDNILADLEGERLARKNAEALNSSLLASSSWKITKPLRSIVVAIRWFRRGVTAWLTLKSGSRPRRIGSAIITHAILWLKLRPAIAYRLLKIVKRIPWLEQRLISAVHRRGIGRSIKVQEIEGDIQWYTDVHPDVQSKWVKLLKRSGEI